MGLDAAVYCDCVERGRLLVPPPPGVVVAVDENGAPYHTSGEGNDEAFDGWYWSGTACPHEHFVLLRRRLGNVSMIGWVRAAITSITSDPTTDCPILWAKVVYSGSHSGDFLNFADVDRLREELDRFRIPADWHYPRPIDFWSKAWWNLTRRGPEAGEQDRRQLRAFLDDLRGLVYASLWVRKPIVF